MQLSTKEVLVAEARFNMMFGKNGKVKSSKKSTKTIAPDEKSIKMKILRSKFIWLHMVILMITRIPQNADGNVSTVSLCHYGRKDQTYLPLKTVLIMNLKTYIRLQMLHHRLQTMKFDCFLYFPCVLLIEFLLLY